MMELLAQAVAFYRDEDLNTEALVMAEGRDGDGESFEFQRALEFDDQDRRLGQDTYCLVVSGGPTYYGGIERWRMLPEGGLEVWLSEEAANVLELHRDITVQFTGESPPPDKMEAGLRRILGAAPQQGAVFPAAD